MLLGCAQGSCCLSEAKQKEKATRPEFQKGWRNFECKTVVILVVHYTSSMAMLYYGSLAEDAPCSPTRQSHPESTDSRCTGTSAHCGWSGCTHSGCCGPPSPRDLRIKQNSLLSRVRDKKLSVSHRNVTRGPASRASELPRLPSDTLLQLRTRWKSGPCLSIKASHF